MPRYIEVVAAARETAEKILALRNGTRRRVKVTTDGGQTASVDWTDRSVTLNMPSLPPDAMLTRTEADRLVAFILHEACHVLHSDMAAWHRAVGDGPRVKAWTNALEDVRIEAKEIAAGMFPAACGLLGTIANHLHGEALQSAPKGYTIGAHVSDAPYVACILGRLQNGYAIPSAHGLAAAMSGQVKQQLDVALLGVRQCASTEDVRQLAKQLVRMEGKRPTDWQPPEGQPGKPEGQPGGESGQEGQDSQDGSEGAQGAQEGQKGADSSQDDQSGQDASQGAQGDPEASQDGDNASAGGQGAGGSNFATDADLSKTIRAISKRTGAKNAGFAHVLSVAETRDSREHPHGNQSRFNAAENAAAAVDLNNRLPRNSVLSGQIGRMLVSEETRRVTHRESTGRLDRRALTRMKAGAQDVFSQRHETPGVDTALMILVDGSGSMASPTGMRGNGMSRTMLAQTAAWHIAKAAETAGAKVCVGVFYGSGKVAQIQVLKTWAERTRDAAAAIASMAAATSTPLAVSVLHGAGMLAQVPGATRRILMVITDGQCDLGSDVVRRACLIAEDLHDVECVGIGMNCSSVTHAFPPRYSVDVEDLDQLAAAGLGALVRMLEDAA